VKAIANIDPQMDRERDVYESKKERNSDSMGACSARRRRKGDLAPLLFTR
jgi:hypothetical protein